MPRALRPFWAAVVRRTAFLWSPLRLILAAVWEAFGRIVYFVFDLVALGLDWIFWHHVDTPGEPYDVASAVEAGNVWIDFAPGDIVAVGIEGPRRTGPPRARTGRVEWRSENVVDVIMDDSGLRERWPCSAVMHRIDQPAPWAFSRVDLNLLHVSSLCRGAVVRLPSSNAEYLVVARGGAPGNQRRILSSHERRGLGLLTGYGVDSNTFDYFHRWATLEEIQAAPELRNLHR